MAATLPLGEYAIAELQARGWSKDPQRPDSWLPPGTTIAAAPTGASPASPPQSATTPEREEANELAELKRMMSSGRLPSKRAGAVEISDGKQPTTKTADSYKPRALQVKRPVPRARKPASASTAALKERPGWNSTPFRRRPIALRGIESVRDEPWKIDEELNYGREAHIEWRHAHKHLVDSGAVPLQSLHELETFGMLKSETLGNRLLNQEKKLQQASRRAEKAAIATQRRAEAEARAAEIAAEQDAKRGEIEAMMLLEAQEADTALRVRLAQLRREAAAFAAELLDELTTTAQGVAEERRAKAEAEEARKRTKLGSKQQQQHNNSNSKSHGGSSGSNSGSGPKPKSIKAAATVATASMSMSKSAAATKMKASKAAGAVPRSQPPSSSSKPSGASSSKQPSRGAAARTPSPAAARRK